MTQSTQSDGLAAGISRSRMLGVSVAAVTAAWAGAAALAGARSRVSLTPRDREVLQFALGLEQLQVAFYAAALRAGNLTGEARQFAQIVAHEEQEHLSYVRHALGSQATAAGQFHFGDTTADNHRFVAAAVSLEETGLAAYNGQAGNVSKSILRALARVLSVEARHAAWARGLAGEVPAPEPTDSPITAQAAMRALRSFQGAGSS